MKIFKKKNNNNNNNKRTTEFKRNFIKTNRGISTILQTKK